MENRNSGHTRAESPCASRSRSPTVISSPGDLPKSIDSPQTEQRSLLDIEELESFQTFPESGQPKEGVDSEDLTVMDVSEPDENDVMEDEKLDDWNIVLNKFGF